MPRTPSHSHRSATQALAAWLLVMLGGAPPYLPAARAEVQGEHVRHGKATFERDGDLTVIRPSNKAIIDYSKFDILKNETVRFEQPNEKSVVLNRVYGNATRIDGTLQANGIVYLVNPAGVFFGGEAIVDVGRLTAAAGDISNDDFLRGMDSFSLTGTLENQGTIRARSVRLLGRQVANYGSIVAPRGVIALVAGDRAVLTQLDGGLSVVVDGPDEAVSDGAGIVQAGLVDASGGSAVFAVGDHYSLALNHTGITRGRDIEARGGDGGSVRVSGTLDASAQERGRKGGRIRVTGTRVQLVGATLDASGAAGGGSIRVGGDLRGRGPMRNALRTFVDADSLLRADALGRGNGGSVVVYAEEAAGFLGRVSARGGAFGGDGGFAELSSGGRLVDDGTFDLRAPAGATGTLLYDPQDILIVGGTADGDDSNDSADLATSILFADEESGAPPFEVFESELEGTNANIVLEARNSIRASGNFDHIANGEGVGVLLIQPGNDLTMRTRNAQGDEIGSLSPSSGIDLTTSDQGADLEIRTGGDGFMNYETGAGDTDGVEAAIHVGKLTTTGAQAGLFTEDGSISANQVTTSGLDGATGGNGGRILLDAGDKDGSNDTSVQVTGDLITRGGNGTDGNGGNGGVVQVETRAAPLPPPDPNNPNAPLPQAKGGGPITIGGNIDNRGGSTTTGNGGTGGTVQVFAQVQGDLQVGDITTRGGDGLDPTANSNGGRGNQVQMFTDDGDIHVGAIDTSGGDSDGNQTNTIPDPQDPMGTLTVPLEFGGAAAAVTIGAGRGSNNSIGTIDDPHGSLLLGGRVTAVGGAGPVNGPDQENGTGFGGAVVLTAHDEIQNDGVAGPQIVTTANVSLEAADIGSSGAIELDGGGVMDASERPNQLTVATDGNADVAIATPGFELVIVLTQDASNDIDIVQGNDEIRVDGDTINRIDTVEEHTDVRVLLQDKLTRDVATGTPPNVLPPNDVALNLKVPTGSIDAGGTLILQSEDDITVGDGAGVAIAAHFDPETDIDDLDDTGPTAADIGLEANLDGSTTGSGAILDGGGRIDRAAGDAEHPDPLAGLMTLRAATGIGTSGAPIQMQGGGGLAATNTASTNAHIGGVFVRNQGDGDLRVLQLGNNNGVQVLAGAGDIAIENTAGDVVVERTVRTTGGSMQEGGAITLSASGGNVVLAAPVNLTAVDAAGDVHFDGDVLLRTDSVVTSRNAGDVAFDGGLDSDPSLSDPERLNALTVNTETVVAGVTTRGITTLAGDVGAIRAPRDLTLNGDVDVAGNRSINVTGTVDISGDVRSAGGVADAGSLAIRSGRNVVLGGDVGVGGRLTSFSVERSTLPAGVTGTLQVPTVSFDGTGDQSVVTGAGGITINAVDNRTQVPDVATIGKTGGGLTLQSDGAIDLGLNEKLTAQGVVNLQGGGMVRFGDVSATELHVTSPDARIRARDPGSVLLRNGGHAQDGGTDILASTVTFSSAPTVEGTGPAPRIATNHVTNPGPLDVRGLSNGIDTSRMVRQDQVLDLAILPADPGNETPERGPVIEGIVPLRTGNEAAGGTALPPGAEETLAWLRCPSKGPADCPQATVGSPLDTPRGHDLALRAQHWLGGTDEAREARAAVAQLDPGALRDLATFMTEVRLLGLSEAEYKAVRDGFYGEILAEAGAGAPAPDVLAQGVRSQARGVPL